MLRKAITMEELLWRRALYTPASLRRSILVSTRPSFRAPLVRHSSSGPTVAQPAFWRSLVPKPFRHREAQADVNFGPRRTLKKPKKDWNPATFYIVMFLFIGSMSIQMISLRKNFSTNMRRAESRISVLREVVEKLQKGEKVDVEKALGTGDPQEEEGWEDVLKEIERDDAIRSPKRNDRSRHSSSARAEPKVAPESQGTSADEKSQVKSASYSGFF